MDISNFYTFVAVFFTSVVTVFLQKSTAKFDYASFVYVN